MKQLTVPMLIIIVIVGIIGLTELQSCKHEPIRLSKEDTTSYTPPASNPGTTNSTDGVSLYANNCAGCHGSLANSAKLGATVSQIQSGISNVAGMNSLSTLTSAQLQAIADVLKTTSPIPPTPTDGATLYANDCAGCHGPLATSAKLGATVSRIQNGIGTVSAMNSLSALTSAQLQSIADALSSTPMPTDGPSLYAINCASCHGTLANSRVGRSSVSEIQEAIRQKRQMNYLSTLTLAQLQAIASSLSTVRGGND